MHPQGSTAGKAPEAVVVGERVDDLYQIIGDYGEADPVPRIDMQTATVLGRAGGFTIVQRPSFSEACCPACERSNIYDIYDGVTYQHIFFAK